MALLKVLLFVVSLGALICLGVFWLRRERARTAAAKQAHDDLIAAHDLEEAYVSGDDGSLVGLSFASGRLVVGTGDARRLLPFSALRSVEGVRDGVVLVRAGRSGPAVAASPEPAALPPHRIHRLGLRVTVDDPDPVEHTILFVDGGKSGLDAENQHLRQQSALAEAWYARLMKAMETAA